MKKIRNDSPFRSTGNYSLKKHRTGECCCHENNDEEPTDDGSEFSVNTEISQESLNNLFSHWLDMQEQRDGNSLFQSGKAWHSAAEKLNRLLNGSLSRESAGENKAHHQASRQLDKLEKAFLQLRRNVADQRAGGVRQRRALASVNHALEQLSEAEMVLHHPEGEASYKTLPHFPRYLYLLTEILQEGMRLGALEEGDERVDDYYSHAEAYLSAVMNSAFDERRIQIRWNQSGANLDQVYIIDRQNQESLTYWVPLTNELSGNMLLARDVLRDRIADAFVEALEIEKIQAVLTQISLPKHPLESWAVRREQRIYLEKYLNHPQPASAALENESATPVVDMKVVYGLILPQVRDRYLPGVQYSEINLRQSQPINDYSIFPGNGEELVRIQIAEQLKRLLNLKLGPDFAKTILGSSLLGAIAPFLHLILDLFWPKPKPITIEDVRAEIDKRLTEVLTQQHINNLKTRFQTVIQAYELRMEVVENANRNEPDKTKWDMGRTSEWESVLNNFNELSAYFFTDEFRVQYQVSPMFVVFATMYIGVLNATMITYKAGDRYSVIMSYFERFFNGWYHFTQQMSDMAWWEVNRIDWDNVDRVRGLPNQYYVVDLYSEKRLGGVIMQYNLTGYDKFDRMADPMDMLKGRVRMYITANTQLRQLAQLYDDTVKEFNATWQTAHRADLISTLVDRNIGDLHYAAHMNYHQSRNPYSNGGAYFNLLLPGLQQSYAIGGQQFARNDCFVGIRTNQGQKWYGPGDYVDLTTRNKVGETEREWIGYDFTLPRGFRLVLYSDINFGEYTDPDSTLLKYRGTSTQLPADGETPWLTGSFPQGLKAVSMRIRIDPSVWFPGLANGRLARVQRLTGRYVTTTDGHRLAVWDDIPAADMDNWE
ncbi:hypothetical protein N5923_24180 [Erwiniaceae bacterium BAC15a-03b]|uniref:Uncharacterized protein n=2 Tax=Winslowiella arboricola TaxID=2978220 RepID=A0A9J6Q0A6_9GAMM|nr:hypothetical protein [Winslowiella arboricola]MCU5780596.1 hypothetical protein [Winslowiella arboricola]